LIDRNKNQKDSFQCSATDPLPPNQHNINNIFPSSPASNLTLFSSFLKVICNYKISLSFFLFLLLLHPIWYQQPLSPIIFIRLTAFIIYSNNWILFQKYFDVLCVCNSVCSFYLFCYPLSLFNSLILLLCYLNMLFS